VPSQYPVTFSGIFVVSGEFFNQIVEALGITVDRHPKERLRKRGNQTIKKIGCVPILNDNYHLLGEITPL